MADVTGLSFCTGRRPASVGKMTTGPRLTPLQLFQTRVHLFHMGVRKRLTVGARAVLLDGEKVLLIRHTYLPGWQFPGGGVEPGETAEMAAAREALEETGYAVAGRAALHGLYLNRIAGGARDHVALYVWRAATKQRDFRPGLEIAACQWFDLKCLPDDIDPGTARRLRELVDGGPPDGEW
jgi:8-oxo-dGTP pyrophosphatase MutT (NUDIX family)